jgi:hypothetical protein
MILNVIWLSVRLCKKNISKYCVSFSRYFSRVMYLFGLCYNRIEILVCGLPVRGIDIAAGTLRCTVCCSCRGLRFTIHNSLWSTEFPDICRIPWTKCRPFAEYQPMQDDTAQKKLGLRACLCFERDRNPWAQGSSDPIHTRLGTSDWLCLVLNTPDQL